MGVRENKVEKYLDERVTALGGATRAWKKSNRDGVMDQIVIFPDNDPAEVHFVEVKTIDGSRSVAQIREATRLRLLKCNVTCVYGHPGVDAYIQDVILDRPIKEHYR